MVVDITQTTAIYGVDIKLDGIGDLALSSTGDIDIISDKNNVAQNIKNIMSTEIGELLYNENYGFDFSLVMGQKNLYKKVSLLKYQIAKALNFDDRIASIISVDIYFMDDRVDLFYVELTVLLKNQQTVLSTNLVFPYSSTKFITSTITSETQTTSSTNIIFTNYTISNIQGVFLATDTTKTGTNYFTGGSTELNKIKLGTLLQNAITNVIIDYTTLDNIYNNIKLIKIDNETKTSDNINTITLTNVPYNIIGIYLDTDKYKLTNYWYENGLPGIITSNVITLPKNLPAAETVVVVDYNTYTRFA